MAVFLPEPNKLCFLVWQTRVKNTIILLNSDLFGKILCFSQPNLQTFFTHTFFMDVALQHFIYNWTNLAHILQDQQELGVTSSNSSDDSDYKQTYPMS